MASNSDKMLELKVETEDSAFAGACSKALNPEEEPIGNDLFYRMKLKLWDRDRITNKIRGPHVKETNPSTDRPYWTVGTRIVVTDDETLHKGRSGRIVEYRGKGWYAIIMEDGHKIVYNPLQFARCADQNGPPQLVYPGEESPRSAARKERNANDCNKENKSKENRVAEEATSGDQESRKNNEEQEAPSEPVKAAPASVSHNQIPNGTRIRIVKSYNGSLLAKEQWQTGEILSFAHGWYYAMLDESTKQTSFRRHSFVLVGDEEDQSLQAASDSKVSKGEGRTNSDSVSKPVPDEQPDPASAEAPKKKRGRPPREKQPQQEQEQQEQEDGSDEDDRDADDDPKKKKSKKGDEDSSGKKGKKKQHKNAETQGKDDQEEEDSKKEAEEKQKKEVDKEDEKPKEEEDPEANLTQEERDMLEAARLAALLNRNPRRRGGPTPDAAIDLALPRIPKTGAKRGPKPKNKSEDGAEGRDTPTGVDKKESQGKEEKEEKEKPEPPKETKFSISAQDIFGDEDDD